MGVAAFWRSPASWSGIPQRPPRVNLGGSSGDRDRGSSEPSPGGSGGQAPARSLAQQRVDADEWAAYLDAMAKNEEWQKRHTLRAWLLGRAISGDVLKSAKLCRVVRESGVHGATTTLQRGPCTFPDDFAR